MTLAVETLRLEAFEPEHLSDAVRLSQQVSWPHRAEDWALTLSQSQGVVAKLGDKVVGTALVSLFGDVATLSMIIVDQEQRGKRIGRRLMEAIIGMADGREMRLVATTDGLPLYRKLGFQVIGEVEQFQGIAVGVAPAIRVQIGDFDVNKLSAMDQAACGLDRQDLISRITSAGTVFHTENGFAVLRDFGRGKVLGPIVAKDLATAKALLSAAARAEAGTFLRIDTPDADLGAFAKTLGLESVGGGACMSARACGAQGKNEFQTFGLVSQALG
ncbi:GNAT family N-acetyltransferase [Tropicibacter sp. R15_0]|uniref:GNAT family N-acetyltransferase n=1 Tax=Tropicibacter sp. R15_0 TaxID=2821101 RepID=UPI001ADB1C9B|nr:GNAT family N-acetyltransferase [Tropicibacter sp. R15_0]MBO9467812.1 GNAT family N-acetyltransferase [Tropicibacter sp. R15_0]